MRVAIAAVGTDSEVLPIMALGKAFLAKGHTVTLCVPEKYRSLSMQVGLRMVSSGTNFQDYLEPRPAADTSRALAEILKKEVAVHFVAMRDTLRHTDVLIGSPLQTAGPSIAEQEGIPYFCAIQTPIYADPSKFPCWGLMAQEGGLFSSLKNRLRKKVWHGAVLTAINYERDFMHLAPARDLYQYFFNSGHQFLAVDSNLCGTENSDIQTSTGFWFFDDQEIESDLQTFLDSASNPVWIDLNNATDDTILDLSRQLRQQGNSVLVRTINTLQLPEGAQQVDPRITLRALERVSFVVHDGCARMSAAAARAGIPQVIQPAFEDQKYWADLLYIKGVSVRPVADPGVDHLLTAVRDGLTNSAIKQKAKEVGEQLRAYDGTLRAVEAVERFVKPG